MWPNTTLLHYFLIALQKNQPTFLMPSKVILGEGTDRKKSKHGKHRQVKKKKNANESAKGKESLSKHLDTHPISKRKMTSGGREKGRSTNLARHSRKKKNAHLEGAVTSESAFRKKQMKREKANRLGFSSKPEHFTTRSKCSGRGLAPSAIDEEKKHEIDSLRTIDDSFLLMRKRHYQHRMRSLSLSQLNEVKLRRREDSCLSGKDFLKDYFADDYSFHESKKDRSSPYKIKGTRGKKKNRKRRNSESDLVRDLQTMNHPVELSTNSRLLKGALCVNNSTSSLVEDNHKTYCIIIKDGDTDDMQVQVGGQKTKIKHKTRSKTAKKNAHSPSEKYSHEDTTSKKEPTSSVMQKAKKMPRKQKNEAGTRKHRKDIKYMFTPFEERETKDDYAGHEARNAHQKSITGTSRSRMLQPLFTSQRGMNWLKSIFPTRFSQTNSESQDAGPFPIEKRPCPDSLINFSSSELIAVASSTHTDLSNTLSTASSQSSEWYKRSNTQKIDDRPEHRMMELVFFESVQESEGVSVHEAS